jgi:hypothetical protein
VALLLSMLHACADDQADIYGGCVGPVREPLDPNSSVHLLANAASGIDDRIAPSSGPHVMGTPLTGVVADPVPAAVQVGVLERGDVMVQYAPGLDVTPLDALAGPHVVVAPNPRVDGVVATAWRHRLTCESVEPLAVEAFVEHYAARGPQMGAG